MEVYCTRPVCPRPVNHFADLDNSATLKTVQQKYCTACGMPLILVGRYVPLKLLGRGGFGAAYLARDRYTPAMRQCVVKQFQPAGDLSPAQLEMAQKLFEREGEVLEELGNKHPQIPDLLAFFELDVPSRTPNKPDRFFYLVQEFIDGHDMERELEQKQQFSEAEVLEVLTEILKVLRFVHSNGSIHRDIKPSNIMRHRDGRLFLLDFGAVKQLTSAAAVQGGKASTGIYSMGFAPPEQMAGNTVYPATDLYALGVTCITLLTGKQPSELYDSYSNDWTWRAYAQVSDRLEAVLNRMLLQSPKQRFQSADEVLEALTSLTAKPVSPPPPPAPAPPPPVPPSRPAAKTPPPPPPSPSPAPVPAPSPAPAPAPVAMQAAPQPRMQPAVRPFSTLELIRGAGFTGFEGGLLAIAIYSFSGSLLLSGGLPLLAIAILVLLQSQRVIEGWDLPIIAGVTLVVVAFVVLRTGGALPALVILAGLVGLLAIAITVIFRLIYALLSRFI
jgi:serine/threonine protein kinase